MSEQTYFHVGIYVYDMSEAIDRYSKDYVELQTKDKVKFYKTPDAILQQQLVMYDQIVEKKSADNPIFKEIVESQPAHRISGLASRLAAST